MSTSPLPPDPYEALGLTKDCDADAIKKAHRRLALKHHPDRIKDPALVEQNKNEFQKVQQAYEILVDPARRQRYDDECKLSQLRKERMLSERAQPTYTKTTYRAGPSAAPANPVHREYRPEARYAYEDRVPDSPYVDSLPRGFEDQAPRANHRKVDPRVEPQERRSSATKPAERKEKTRATGWEREKPAREKPSAGMSMKMAFSMKAAAQGARVRVKEKEKEKEREAHAKSDRLRTKEHRSARDQKAEDSRSREPTVEEYFSDSESSSSDSDTIVDPRRSAQRMPPTRRRTLTPVATPRRQKQSPSRARQLSPQPMSRGARQSTSPQPMSRAAQQSSPRLDPRGSRQLSPGPIPRSARHSSPRAPRSYYEEDDSEGDKHERQFAHAQGYQHTAARRDPRPTPSRQGSDIREYWQPGDGRSGSDSDRQPPSSHRQPRRGVQEEPRSRPPLPTQTSAPSGIRVSSGMVDREAPAKSHLRGNSYSSNDPRREAPGFYRSPSEPLSAKLPSKRDSAPVKPSTLKQTDTVNHDSGYGSSNPQTPETRGESPPPPPRDGRTRETSTKYRVGKEEDAPRARKMEADPAVPLSRYLSPQDVPQHHHHNHHPESRERDRHRSRSRDREADVRHVSGSSRPTGPERVGSSRPTLPEKRSSYSRHDSSGRYEEAKSRSIRAESEREYFSYPGEVKQMRPKAPTFSGHPNPSFSKHYDGASQAHTPSSYPRYVNARRPSVC